MDPGICGPAYVAPSIYQNAQECLNWRLERDPTKADGDRGQWSLYPTPGLITKFTLTAAEVRGLRAVQGGSILLVVCGSTLYSVNSVFASTVLGSLSTSVGRVSITDNGQAAYITDGFNRYSYAYAGGVFTAVSDGGFTGGGVCDSVDGYMVYTQPATQNWGATSLNLTTSIALSVAKKDGASDNLVTLIVNDREIYLLGEYTTEVWADVGTFPFPFARVPGTSSQHGCAAAYSLSRLGNSFAYLSQDRNGQGIVVVMQGYGPKEISTHAVTSSIQNQKISDAAAFTYQLEGHEVYVITFPTIDLTWCYDAATEQWHKWMSVDAFNTFHRHRGNCQALFQGLSLVGDYQNGKVYALDNSTYTEAGSTIRRLRRTPHVVQDFLQVYHQKFQIQLEPGVGLETGQGSDPQAMLRWSNDGGSTWSNEHWRSIGRVGKYRNRAVWRRLGQARDRVYEVVVTDPIKAVIVSAELDTELGDN